MPLSLEERAEVNRQNAQKSTGPKTVEGKMRSRMSALRHGLTAQSLILHPDDAKAYLEHCEEMILSFRPVGKDEEILAQLMADSLWQANYAYSLELNARALQAAPLCEFDAEYGPISHTDVSCAAHHAFVHVVPREKQDGVPRAQSSTSIEWLGRHRARNERLYLKYRAELKTAQKERLAEVERQAALKRKLGPAYDPFLQERNDTFELLNSPALNGIHSSLRIAGQEEEQKDAKYLVDVVDTLDAKSKDLPPDKIEVRWIDWDGNDSRLSPEDTAIQPRPKPILPGSLIALLFALLLPFTSPQNGHAAAATALTIACNNVTYPTKNQKTKPIPAFSKNLAAPEGIRLKTSPFPVSGRSDPSDPVTATPTSEAMEMTRDKLESTYIKRLTASVQNIYPDIRTIAGCPTNPEVVIDGRKSLLICSPNYLGLSSHREVIRAFLEATLKYGAGTVGSGLISGYTAAHRDVEEDIARFMNEEAAIFYNAVSDASAGVIAAVVNPPLLPVLGDVSRRELGSSAVFVDSQNHASILDAVRLAKPDKTYVYRHCDAEHLAHLLRRSSHARKLVITDGYFSMSARVAPLVAIADLCQETGALLLVDDAHGTGVFGENGRGTPEMLGVEDRVDFWIGAASKGLGVRGAFIAGPRELMDYLRVSSRRYVFSGTLPAGVPAAVSQALETADLESWRRRRVLANAEKLRAGLRDLGCHVLGEGHIVPWFIGDDAEADCVSQVLQEQGVFASAVRFPAVARGQALVRFMLMASHTDEHIQRTLQACARAISSRYSIPRAA